MISYFAFMKKEFLENIRTYKLLIIVVVFIIFGISSPLTAKLTPEIISSFMPKGISITITEPTALDAWTQFFKNISQIGLILFIALFSGMLATELSKGTLIIMLTKGLPRQTVIFAKFVSSLIIFTLSFVIASLICFLYTYFLFKDNQLENLVFALFVLWLYTTFLLATLTLMATLTKTNYSALLLTGLVVVIMMTINIFEPIQKFNPLYLSSNNVMILNNTVSISSFTIPIVITIIATAVMIWTSILIFNKKQL